MHGRGPSALDGAVHAVELDLELKLAVVSTGEANR
jgi:hypothetical protein